MIGVGRVGILGSSMLVWNSVLNMLWISLCGLLLISGSMVVIVVWFGVFSIKVWISVMCSVICVFVLLGKLVLVVELISVLRLGSCCSVFVVIVCVRLWLGLWIVCVVVGNVVFSVLFWCSIVLSRWIVVWWVGMLSGLGVWV